MTCQCAKLAGSDGTWIATFFNGKCTVAQCGMGVVVIDYYTSPADFTNPMVGHCACFRSANGSIAQGWTNDPHAVAVVSGNTGDICEKPQCPALLMRDGSLGPQCNVPDVFALQVPFTVSAASEFICANV